jgi:NitT/TauT family transport system ATP-binding protein
MTLLSQTESPLVRLTQSRVSFHGRQVLAGSTLAVHRSEAVGIWGRNAVGKSTLLKVVAGLLEPDNSGSIARHSHIRVGYLPQDPMHALLPWKHSWKNVLIHSRYSFARKDATSWLERFGFDGVNARADAFPLELSGGTIQRLGWACAMLPGKELLVLDEPFAEQDSTWCRRLCSYVREAVGRGIGVILVAHEPELLGVCCDRIIRPNGESVSNTITRNVMITPTDRPSWDLALQMAQPLAQDLRKQLLAEVDQ